MNSLLVGNSLLIIFLVYGLVTGNWGITQHWMFIVGGIALFLGLILTGAFGRSAYAPMDRSVKRGFRRVSFIMFMIGCPNLVVAIVLFYVTHPG